MTLTPWLAALIAIFLWWFFTGAILCRVRIADRIGGDAHLWSVILTMPFALIGVWGIQDRASDPSAMGAGLAFFAALMVWGWIELAFLSGVVTGPYKGPALDKPSAWRRFLAAWGTLAYHEILLLAALTLLTYVSLGAANPFGLWTFAVLFFARISAKLNLYFGVPRINTDFLPQPLAHLKTHFRQGSPSLFWPISAMVLTGVSALWLLRLGEATTPGAQTGYTLLAVLTLLALLEHLFMVVPLPDDKLWRWMLPAPKPETKN
ncbi:MAG: putative photosynthetic complex assembly protein PuhE [Pseudomonadota bacterium]